MSITKNVVITNTQGLHARPAAELVEAMKAFEASVSISIGEKQADTRSIMSVLALGATTGSEATVMADGPDAEDAVSAAIAIMVAEG